MNDTYSSNTLIILQYAEQLGCYASTVEIGDVPVTLMFHLDEDDDLKPAVHRAYAILAEFNTYSHRAEAYAVQELLSLKNDMWLEEDEAPVTEAQFKQRMTLDALTFYAEGAVTFYYQDGDLFWGHTIELGMDAAGEFTRAVVAG